MIPLKIKNPEIVECLPELPLNSLDLQANIKKVVYLFLQHIGLTLLYMYQILDNVQPYAHVEGSMIIVDYQDLEKTDALIRWTILDFMMSPQMLGLLPQYQTIIRLFPRSVIKLQTSCLLQAYKQSLQHENANFIAKFIHSQV